MPIRFFTFSLSQSVWTVSEAGSFAVPAIPFYRRLGFCFSYAGYFFLPAVGPRFTLHDFSRTDIDLPGLLFTPLCGGSSIIGNRFLRERPAAAFACAQRDVFPSGHTMMTMVAVILAYKFRLGIRRYVLGMGYC